MTTGVVPLAPIYGGVAASHHLSDAPLLPIQLTGTAHSPPHQTTSSPANRAPASSANRTPASPASPARQTTCAPSFPHHTPSSPAHRALASSAHGTRASPARRTTPRAQTMQPNDQAVNNSQFFIVLIGYSPGVYTSM